MESETSGSLAELQAILARKKRDALLESFRDDENSTVTTTLIQKDDYVVNPQGSSFEKTVESYTKIPIDEKNGDATSYDKSILDIYDKSTDIYGNNITSYEKTIDSWGGGGSMEDSTNNENTNHIRSVNYDERDVSKRSIAITNGQEEGTISGTDIASLEAERKTLEETLQASNAQVEELRPRYEERMLANQVPPELLRSVTDAEMTLREVEEESNTWDRHLNRITQTYLEEYETHEKLLSNLSTRLLAVQDALHKKIHSTNSVITGENGEPLPHPSEALGALETLTKEREQEALNLARQLRELRHILDAKETRRSQLEAESVSQIRDVATVKDSEIRQMVQQIHQERDMILNDIQDVRVVNREQAFNLRRGQIQKGHSNVPVFNPPKTAKLRTPTRTDALATEPVRATTRKAQFRADPKPSEGEVALVRANEELETERAELTARLHRATSDKNDLMKSIKVAKENSKKETEQRRQLLRELEMQTLAARRRVAQLEDENMKLEETCEALTITLKSTKQQYTTLTERRNLILPNMEVPAIEG